MNIINDANNGNHTNHIVNEPHEAIRPTNISIKELPNNFSMREKNIYQLIL
jgi:DNA topoisomerase IA